AALNPTAERIAGTSPTPPADVLFAASRSPHPDPPPQAGEGAQAAPQEPSLQVGEGARGGDLNYPPPLAGEGVRREAADGWGHTAVPSHGIATFPVILDRPISRLDFARALGHLAMDRGNDLLRVKGILRFADRPERPAIVQAAQHAMFAPEWLDDWPDD